MIQGSRIGIIGVGLMGSALAERLLGAGFDVIGYDRVSEKSAALAARGGRSAGSPRAVAEASDSILFSLMSTDQVAASLDAMGSGLRPGTTVIDTTTGSPEQMAALGERLAALGIDYLDATIAGNSDEARAGAVLVLAGGEGAAFHRARQLFDCFAREAFHLGSWGSGARMKLVFNLVVGLHRAVLGEALGFARAVGVAPETALAILKAGAAYSRVMDVKGDRMLSRDFRPQARLAQHLKDVRLILELAGQTGAIVPLSERHAELLTALVEAGCGELDNSAIARAFDPELP
jgi:3-hydroxyisobutyrate dehydrogenase-like beta-hydroxyacid dehydrogenase